MMFHLQTLENAGSSILDSQIRGVEGTGGIVTWVPRPGRRMYYVPTMCSVLGYLI